ncbi:polyprenol phosphomannose-dependent alpha 1,6 mannosyltransferase MptB [Actinoplanes sp. NPDC049265]|uniref:polyprenol phosphomannose-dependent alpha 1,6 mannosyltransferase MptB n=1 Tax=Actinoplanes sp. NPDC049265 TaxID=3363902 RepID=UPI003718BAE1
MPGPATIRYGGLAGSLLLALAAARHGADASWSPTMTARTILSGVDGWLTPAAWLAGTLLLVTAWWLGRRRVPSLRWAYVTAALWALPLLFVLPLGSYDVYSYACQGWALAAGHDPYAAGVAAYQCPWLDAVAPTWRDAPAPYGPVFLLLAALAALTGGSLTGVIALLRLTAVLGVVLIAVCVPVLARRHAVDPARAVWLAVACPLVPIHLISGAHNDAVMVGLLTAGLALAAADHLPTTPSPSPAARPRSPRLTLGRLAPAAGPRSPRLTLGRLAPAWLAPAWLASAAGPRRAWLAPASYPRATGLIAAGALIGLAGGVKATALVVLPFAMLPLRRNWLVLPGALASLGVVSLASGLGFGWVTALSGSGVSVQWTSPPTAVGMTAALFGAGDAAITVTRLLGLAALAVLLVVLFCRFALRTNSRPLRPQPASSDSPQVSEVGDGGSRLAAPVGTQSWKRSSRASAADIAQADGADSGDSRLEATLGTQSKAAAVAMAATVALAPVFHPWYLTWPLAVLAATLRRDTLWLVVPCAVASVLCLPDGYNLALATKAQGAIAMTAVVIGVIGYAVRRRRA